jgi:hypothetical protein
MPTWEPNADDPVGPKEMLGRRIFTDKIWEGELGAGAGRFRVDHFYDDDPEADFSVDRLGRASEEGPVVRRVGRLAHAEGQNRTPACLFTGWAACGRQHFFTKKCHIAVNPKPIGSNRYHAEMVRDEYRRHRTGLLAFATLLCHVFSLQGHFHKSPPPPTPKEPDGTATRDEDGGTPPSQRPDSPPGQE